MIVFTKNLPAINMVYNDSIIQFNSNSISNPINATLTFGLSIIGGLSFTVVPFNNTFTFNFKEVIKNQINTNRFEDTRTPNFDVQQQASDAINIYNDTSLARRLFVTIKIQSATQSESVQVSYTFLRGVQQLYELRKIQSGTSNLRIMLPTNNFVDHNVTYFEGYPFDFGIFGIGFNQQYYFRNITTNQVSPIYINTGLEIITNPPVKRVFLSDGANDSTFDDAITLSSTLNRLELYVQGQFKANINIKRVESSCGVYLKWVNSKGAYSYWKFDSVYKSTITPRSLGEFNGSYDNLPNIKAVNYQIGNTATQTMSVQSNYDMEDADYLSDLGISPAVWMYVHHSPFNKQGQYDFIGVKVNDIAFTAIDTKNTKNKMALTITMPEIQSMTN